MPVTFHFVSPVKLSSRRKIATLVKTIFAQEDKKLDSLSIIFCDDDYLLEMNVRYLSHNYFTDIITFDLSENDKTIGEIYISIDSAKNNAKKYKVLLINELIRLITHGCLHLCSYRDKKKVDKTLMTAKENEYLLLFETM